MFTHHLCTIAGVRNISQRTRVVSELMKNQEVVAQLEASFDLAMQFIEQSKKKKS